MRTGSTPAKSRTILCMRAVPSAALGVRRRLLRSGRRGRRRIVLTGPSLPPPLSLSGLQNRRRLGRRNQNRDRCPLWINRLALPDSRAVAAASRFIHSSAEAPIQPPTWLLQRHPTLVTKSPNKRTSRQPSTAGRRDPPHACNSYAYPSSCALPSFVMGPSWTRAARGITPGCRIPPPWPARCLRPAGGFFSPLSAGRAGGRSRESHPATCRRRSCGG